MRSALFVLVLIVLVLGFYLGWFGLSSHNNPSSSDITLSVDKDKMESDKDKAVDKVQDMGNKVADKIEGTREPQDDAAR